MCWYLFLIYNDLDPSGFRKSIIILFIEEFLEVYQKVKKQKKTKVLHLGSNNGHTDLQGFLIKS